MDSSGPDPFAEDPKQKHPRPKWPRALPKSGARDRDRTGDPQLGNILLRSLRYRPNSLISLKNLTCLLGLVVRPHYGLSSDSDGSGRFLEGARRRSSDQGSIIEPHPGRRKVCKRRYTATGSLVRLLAEVVGWLRSSRRDHGQVVSPLQAFWPSWTPLPLTVPAVLSEITFSL